MSDALLADGPWISEPLTWKQICERFPDEWVAPGIDGLLGLSFLKRFNFEIRSVEGRILVERATS